MRASPLRFVGTAMVLSGLCSLVACATASRASLLPSDDLFWAPERAAGRFAPAEPLEARRLEVVAKLARVRDFLASRPLDGVLLTTLRGCAWVLAGCEDLDELAPAEFGIRVLITPTDAMVIAPRAVAVRLARGPAAGLGLVVLAHDDEHHEPADEVVARVCPDFSRVATDASPSGDYVRLSVGDRLRLMSPVLAGEEARYEWLGSKCAEAVESVARHLRPGMSERDLRHLLARELAYWDIAPTRIVALVDGHAEAAGPDERATRRLRSAAMLEVSGRRWGLEVTLARWARIGGETIPSSEDVERSARILEGLVAATRAGASLGDIVTAASGFAPDTTPRVAVSSAHEGPSVPRAALATRLPAGTAVTLGSSLVRPCFLDTWLVTADGLRRLTSTGSWPTRLLAVGDIHVEVADCLVETSTPLR